MTKIIPIGYEIHSESYDETKIKWNSMQVNDVFSEWMEIKDSELKEALKVYVRNRMGSNAGLCLK